MKTQLQNNLETLRSSYWFVPGLMLVSAIGLSFLTQDLDDRYQLDIARSWPGVFQGGPSGARSMLAAIAGSMITAAAVTFSITIAALSNASSQFGPRLLRIFMQDTGSQIVLGTLLGTFTYCLLALSLVPVEDVTDYVPPLSIAVALLLALASIGVLIYFIHHMASMLQISHVTATVGTELLSAIDRLFPEHLGWGPVSDEPDDAIRLSEVQGSVLPDGDQYDVIAEKVGYIQAVDEETLMELTTRHDVVVRIAMRPGAFVVQDSLVGVIWPAERVTDELVSELQDVFLVGNRRTAFQDIELHFDELIEIALRALSPGINDPYTAFTCIDWLTAGLAELARSRMPSRYRRDENGVLRVIADSPRLDQLIDRTFDRIRNAGVDHPAVLLSLVDSAHPLGPLLRGHPERKALRRQLRAIDGVVRASTFSEHEREALTIAYRNGIEALNQTS